MRRADVRDELLVVGYRVASWAAQHLGDRSAAVVERALRPVVRRLMRKKRSIVGLHQQRVSANTLTPSQLEVAVDAAFESYLRYWLESFRLPGMKAEYFAQRMTVVGMEHLEAALAKGNGAILALPHLGGWDFAGGWLTQMGYPPAVSVEAIEPAKLLVWFTKFREGLGMTVIANGVDSVERLRVALSQNRVVCLVCDRDLSQRGPEVTFFGETTSMPAGPAYLAARTGAPLLPVCVYDVGTNEHRGVICAPINPSPTGHLRNDVQLVMQSVAHQLEKFIRDAPTQWHLFQPNWPSDPGYRKRSR